MILGATVVVIEVWIDFTEASLILSGVFPLPTDYGDEAVFWAHFHKGLNAAVQERQQDGWKWRGSESTFQPYEVTDVNIARVRQATSVPVYHAARWQALIDLPSILEVGNRYRHLEGNGNGKAT